MREKIDLIAALYPQISPKGQDYLRNMVGTLNLIQSPALYPLYTDMDAALTEQGRTDQSLTTHGGNGYRHTEE